MKSRMIKTALAASLMIAAGAASAQQMYYRTAQVPGQSSADTYSAASTNQGAMMQDQSGDASYGGASMGTTSWGNSGMNDSASSKPCTRGPQCNIFFGN
jgi:hypothetical protein